MSTGQARASEGLTTTWSLEGVCRVVRLAGWQAANDCFRCDALALFAGKRGIGKRQSWTHGQAKRP